MDTPRLRTGGARELALTTDNEVRLDEDGKYRYCCPVAGRGVVAIRRRTGSMVLLFQEPPRQHGHVPQAQALLIGECTRLKTPFC